MHQAGSSSDGAGLEPEVPDDTKGKSIDTHEGTSLKPGVPDLSKVDSLDSEYESWGVSDDDDNDDDQQGDDERTKFDDVKSVDLNKTDDEKETQEDVFIHTPDDYVPTDDETDDLKDVELADEGKGDDEMTNADKVNVELKEVNQEVVASSSPSVSSNYGSIFLNLDNISSVKTEIISMLDVQVQHENPSIQTSSLLTITVSVIPEPLVIKPIC
ncbi:hypothetical protein Tco_1069181 [Tanacetum coccineum]|uniref:Uncharacterized protein n=1 Tax=Tanacetum coccineum TaxID=301880 RepID=A0ABQ5HJA0_9ASTR